MQDVRARMGGLHHLLTAATGQGSRYDYPPRHLWGDISLPEGRPPTPRRSLPKRLLRWKGSAR